MIQVLTDPASGGTFLSWTLHYLAGHTEYWQQKIKKYVSLVDNPLQTNHSNAHQFLSNEVNYSNPNCTVNQFRQFVTGLEATPTDTFHVLYFHPFGNSDTTQAAFEYINSSNETLIVVDTSETPLYHCSDRKRTGIFNNDGILVTDNKDIQQYYIQKYFADSYDKWQKSKLTSVWDLREFVALNSRPFLFDPAYQNVDKTKKHFVIKGCELWSSLHFGLHALFDFCEIEINQQRLASWLPIYHTWQKFHYQKIQFSRYFEHIVHGILNNYYMDLLPFDLDLEQEAAIQHALLYKHNLNLKTWQLEKFTSTKQLHSLLEPNIHPLSS